MKKIFAFVCLFGFSIVAHATVLNFDDLSDSGNGTQLDTLNANYGGLSWDSNWYVLNTTAFTSAYGQTGYANSNVSGDNILYNGFGNEVMTSASAFDFNGAYFTAAWNDGLNIEAIGLSGGSVLYDTTFTVNTSGPTWFNANFAGIDTIEFISSGGTPNVNYSSIGSGVQFAMDNFTFNANSVPEPSGLLLMGIGLFGLAFVTKKKSA